jgi:hypothetical protein
MISTFYIIVAILSIPLILNSKKLLYDIYSYSLLRNSKVEKYIENFTLDALKLYNLNDYEVTRYNDIKIVQDEEKPDRKIVKIEVFVATKVGKWNVLEKLIQIEGMIKDNLNYIRRLEEIHSMDLGMIVPENSTKYQNYFFRQHK